MKSNSDFQRLKRNIGGLLAAAFFLCCGALAAAEEAPPTYEPRRLSPTLYELRIDIGYMIKVLASIGPDGVLLVDTGGAENVKELMATLTKLGGGTPKIIILSHSHGEHWEGSRAIGAGPLYIGHENLRRRLQNGPFQFLELPETILPRLTLRDTLSIHFNGEEIRIRSFAGAHDDSDLVVWFTGSKVAFIGALAGAHKLPTVDGSTGDIRRYPEITRAVLDYLPADVLLVPGHGEDASHADGVQFLEMLEKTAALVRGEIAKGKDLEALNQADLLKEWQSWEVSYSNRAYWLRALYEGWTGVKAAQNALKTVHGPLFAAYREKGAEAAVRKYRELKALQPKDYLFDDRSLVGIAYTLAGEGKNHEAIPFFELLLGEFPESRYETFALDGLSRAYEAVGDQAKAVATLSKLLARDPANIEVARRLKELKKKK